MSIQEGDQIPNIELTILNENGLNRIQTEELFEGKKVILFAVPGAYTPACSDKHLPGFSNAGYKFKKKGIDFIACLSTNDSFVLDAWAKSQNVNDIVMLSDGNGLWTKAIGLELDASGFNMGIRSQRYAMLINNGRIEKLNLEDGIDVTISSAETILESL